MKAIYEHDRATEKTLKKRADGATRPRTRATAWRLGLERRSIGLASSRMTCAWEDSQGARVLRQAKEVGANITLQLRWTDAEHRHGSWQEQGRRPPSRSMSVPGSWAPVLIPWPEGPSPKGTRGAG